MLGVYDNFPQNIYHVFFFSSTISAKRLQQALIGILFALNNEALELERVAMPSLLDCKVAFEVGIAEETDFNYLDAEERAKLLKVIKKRPFEIIDFLSLLRYHRREKEKRILFRSDYFILRFKFAENSFWMQIFHEKGPIHVSPGELAEFFVDRINETFLRKVVKPLDI